MSKLQDDFKQKLQTVTDSLNLTVLCEDTNPQETTLLLNNGRKHIVDFLIPEYNLYIELSGNNYLPKILKMKQAHHIPNIQYFALLDISNSILALPKINVQQKELFELLSIKNFAFTDFSLKRLNELVNKFQTMYNSYET